VVRLNSHLARVFFGDDAVEIPEAEFEGPVRDLARLLNVFLRDVRSAVDSARSAEAKALASEQRLSLVAECSEDAIVALDRTGAVIFANQAWTRRTGLDPAKVLQPPFQIVHPGDRSGFRTKLTMAFVGEGFRMKYRVLGPDKSERWVDGQWNPLRDDQGRPLGVVGVERDETVQRENEAKQQAARRFESLGRLAGGIAHDFNNLLTVFSVQLDALREHMRHETRGLALLEPMDLAAARATDLVRQLLVFGGKTQREIQRFDLRDSVKETVGMLRRALGEGIRVESELEPEPVMVLGDPSQISQVLMNLCVNARDAMEQGGCLRVTVRSARATDPVGYGILEVTDTGSGIPAKDHERVFEPFFSTKPPGRGTGLGLALVHEIVERHHGAVELSSQLGIGTSVRVRLPLHAQAAIEPSPSEEPENLKSPAPLVRLRVLLVESNAELRSVLRGYLERDGHRVFVAKDAREALVLARGSAHGFQVLITNALSFEGSGASLVEDLTAVQPEFGVVLTTGSSAHLEPGSPLAERLRGRSVQALSKPFAPSALRAVLSQFSHLAAST